MLLLEKYDVCSLEQDLADFSISLEKRQICQLLNYYELLTEKNKVMNLTAITEYEDVLKKHFVDSLSLAACMDFSKPLTLIDVGTGAGFPGIPLKIAFPQLRITLLDSLKKRVDFLRDVIEALGLTKIEAIHGRAEDLARPGAKREAYDVCVSRAVANLATLSEYCVPFVRKGGIFAAYKSERVTEELDAARKGISLLGCRMLSKKEFVLPHSDLHRTIVLFQKEKETPKRFPRKAGLPSKAPLSGIDWK